MQRNQINESQVPRLDQIVKGKESRISRAAKRLRRHFSRGLHHASVIDHRIEAAKHSQRLMTMGYQGLF